MEVEVHRGAHFFDPRNFGHEPQTWPVTILPPGEVFYSVAGIGIGISNGIVGTLKKQQLQSQDSVSGHACLAARNQLWKILRHRPFEQTIGACPMKTLVMPPSKTTIEWHQYRHLRHSRISVTRRVQTPEQKIAENSSRPQRPSRVMKRSPSPSNFSYPWNSRTS